MPSLSSAQSAEFREYVVHGGDTLWGISGKELNDTFLWPQVWKENPSITNPDRIYPGQTIRIPLYLIQREKQDEAAVSTVSPERRETLTPEVGTQTTSPSAPKAETQEPERIVLEPLVGKNLLMASGYIANTVSAIGKIYGSPEKRNLFGNNDIVYVRSDRPLGIGDRFFVIRPGTLVKHPVSGKTLGYVVEIRGIAQITKFQYGETEAKIIQMFNDIETNDLLDTYYEIEPPLTTGTHRTPDIRGMVVASQSLKDVNGNHDIVYIDKGQKDGIEIGDVLQTLIIGEHTVPNSRIQVINYRETTATAIVRSFTQPVAVGNAFVKAE
jgi:hypothetical protein